MVEEFSTMQPGRRVKAIAAEIVRAILRFLLRYFHQLEARGMENVPASGPVVLISNHGSYHDPVIIRALMRRSVSFMAWAKIFSWPVVGWLARLGGAFPINLEHRQDVEGFRAAIQQIRNGRLLGIFPEAARAMGPLMEDAKLGAIHIALLAEADIIPVSLAGVHDVWPRRRTLPQPGKIAVTFHPPIRIQRRHFESHAEERAFMRQVMAQVQSVINAEIAARLRAWGAQGCVGASLRRLEGTDEK